MVDENYNNGADEGGVPSGIGVINTVLDRIKGTARVELVYGDAKEMHGKTIVPIAAVAYTFGAGAGAGIGSGRSHNGHGTDEGVGGGGGGGGSVRVQPVGVLEITDEDTRIVPALDWTRIATTALTVFGVWMVFRQVFRKR